MYNKGQQIEQNKMVSRWKRREIDNKSKVKLVTVVEGDQKAPFLIDNTPRCTGGHYSFRRIAPFYPWYVPYNAVC